MVQYFMRILGVFLLQRRFNADKNFATIENRKGFIPNFKISVSAFGFETCYYHFCNTNHTLKFSYNEHLVIMNNSLRS